MAKPFHSDGLFTATIDQMSAWDSSDTHKVLSELFRSMNTKLAEREAGGLFTGSLDWTAHSMQLTVFDCLAEAAFPARTGGIAGGGR